MRKLRPENNAGRGKVSPDGARGFDARELRHLYVEDADRGLVLQGQLYSLFASAASITGACAPNSRSRISRQVVALRHVVFSNQDGHGHDLTFVSATPVADSARS